MTQEPLSKLKKKRTLHLPKTPSRLISLHISFEFIVLIAVLGFVAIIWNHNIEDGAQQLFASVIGDLITGFLGYVAGAEGERANNGTYNRNNYSYPRNFDEDSYSVDEPLSSFPYEYEDLMQRKIALEQEIETINSRLNAL